MADSEAQKRSLEGNGNGTGNGDAKKPKTEEGPKGVLLFSGATDFSDVGRKAANLARSNNTIWKPAKLKALEDVDVVEVVSGPTSVHSVVISKDGKAYAWGRNEKGQLGVGHTNDLRRPQLVEALIEKEIVSAATGRNHTLFLAKDGSVYACGDNRSGQVGPDKTPTVNKPRLITYDGPPAKKVACGADFSVIVDVQGNLWTWGHPEHGQLGHNTEGSYLEKAGKVNFDFVYVPTRVSLYVEKDPKSKAATPIIGVTIKDVTCGINHCVAIDEKNRAFSWGFGGYGRLGHSETGNELVPRLIKFFDGPRRGVVRAVSGGQFTLAVAELAGTTYMWGQYNSSKEANMYPKPIPDLSGWMDVRSIGCSGKGWIVSADDAVIAAVPSPCYGELAMGEMKKSSANPVEVKTLTDIHVEKCAMGMAHSLFLAKPMNEKQKLKLDNMKVLDQSND